MRNQKGFTLIELIIVIVVLGILAVTAAPQFFNFSGDARESAVKGLKGNIQGAYQTVYAKAAVDGDFSTAIGDVTISNGYPTADASGIVEAANLGTNGEDWVFASGDGNGTAVADTFYIAPAGFDSLSDTSTADDIFDASCYVSYVAAENTDTPPTVTIDVSGCGN
ncbi:prepilin-type N-terminal cleavage/methylation domain-containing protein [Idiomarina baltica]|uniref:Type II secretory pathway, pseudopilin n=1 Tax=Idiomarina baltica OS145 TaxID=314276 RepID=A0ABP2CNY6_9GAMM|nr:type II secretion system protein [Idiomarina baltica]EAQ31348.1 Type II secretory pathway, pseudopilin [Idiomarina baltica OS145]